MKLFKYFMLGILFWVVVDFTTVYFPDHPLWEENMPGVWVVYFGYPLIFSVVFYKWELTGVAPIGIMLSFLVLIEIVIVNNPLLLTFPDLLIGMPIAFAIYMLITYVPKYIVDGECGHRKKEISAYIVVWLISWLFTAINRIN
ncbi:hypothetical protein ACFL2V_00235 [Pseudomonadota bacterium]